MISIIQNPLRITKKKLTSEDQLKNQYEINFLQSTLRNKLSPAEMNMVYNLASLMTANKIGVKVDVNLN